MKEVDADLRRRRAGAARDLNIAVKILPGHSLGLTRRH